MAGGDLEDAITRLNAYFDAGADCALPILSAEYLNADTMREFVRRLKGPLNAPAMIKLSVGELDEIGVARAGVQFNWALHGFVGGIAEEVLGKGTKELMAAWPPQVDVSGIFQDLVRQRAGAASGNPTTGTGRTSWP